MKALILSGGTGSRLRPLTYTHAKQLLPLANKPVLYHIIDKIVESGVRDIGIITGDTQEEVKSSVGNGERWKAKISYIYQPLPLGLAHAVKMASAFIDDDDFLMLLGDNAFSMGLDKLIENFYANKSNSAILLHKVENPSQYGVAVVENNRIKRVIEKPKEFISDLIITGVYLFDNSIFRAIENTLPSPRGELEITDAIQKQLEMGGKVTFEIIQGWWKDTGKLQDILEANRFMLEEINGGYQVVKKDDSVYMGKIQIGENVVIKNSVIDGPVTIADDSVIINSYVGPYTAVGKGVRINNCEVDNCIILENTQLDSISKRISGSLIGKNVVIRAADKKPVSSTFLVGDNSEIYM